MNNRKDGILTAAFGMTVALWAAGYVARLPAVMLPSPALLLLLLGCILGGGIYLGRHRDSGVPDGAWAGAVSGLLNLLILGSFLSGAAPGELRSAALIWVPGSILLSAGLGALGAAIGGRLSPTAPVTHWTSSFARVAAVATFLLLAVGGLVTSAEAGLAVVDWPNSFGYNMFLYPFSRMTGGIYYEHAHRLFGALVGLTTLTLAILLQRRDSRASVRLCGWLAFVMVVIQGILGGLRVTGTFTMSAEPSAMSPSTLLAVVHGVFGQIFFATLVALAAVTSKTWQERNPKAPGHVPALDVRAGWVLLGLMILQLTLGASQRHLDGWLMAHLAVGLLFVTPLALFVGTRAWDEDPARAPLSRSGLALGLGVGFQVLLGFLAYAVTGAAKSGAQVRVWDLTVSTAHQWFGAALLAATVLTLCWNRRFRRISAGSSPVAPETAVGA